MGKVIANAAMSLDGFVADTDDAVGPLRLPPLQRRRRAQVVCTDQVGRRDPLPGSGFHRCARHGDRLRHQSLDRLGADLVGAVLLDPV